jgi:hypothetical protein
MVSGTVTDATTALGFRGIAGNNSFVFFKRNFMLKSLERKERKSVSFAEEVEKLRSKKEVTSAKSKEAS